MMIAASGRQPNKRALLRRKVFNGWFKRIGSPLLVGCAAGALMAFNDGGIASGGGDGGGAATSARSAFASSNSNPENVLGANFNAYFPGVDYRDLRKAHARWARMFLPMPDTDDGAANAAVVQTILDVADHGYHTILSLKWPYQNKDFPRPDSAGMRQELDRLDALLPLVMGKVDILVIGNEPYVETRAVYRDADLNAFYEAMAAHVIAYRTKHCAAKCRTHLYMGALNRLDLPKNITASTERWMQYVKETPEIDGVDIHPHVPSLQASKAFLDYILPRMRPDQKFIATEFSLVWSWRRNMNDPVSAAFADKYSLPHTTKNWQVVKSAIDNPFSKKKWDNFLSSSPWFEDHKHFLVNEMNIFRGTGRLAVATYDFEQGGPMAKHFGPQTPWIINPVFAPRTVRHNLDGSNAANYAWIDDFRALQKE